MWTGLVVRICGLHWQTRFASVIVNRDLDGIPRPILLMEFAERVCGKDSRKKFDEMILNTQDSTMSFAIKTLWMIFTDRTCREHSLTDWWTRFLDRICDRHHELDLWMAFTNIICGWSLHK